MSRAYRILVSESLRKIIKAEDHVCTQLEILNVLPAEEMSQLLTDELQRRGFSEQDGKMIREQDGIQIIIDPQEGTVTVQAADCEEVHLEMEREDWTYDRNTAQAQHNVEERVRKDLANQANRDEAELQAKLTDKLEAELGDLRKELDQVANQVTATALKRKAAQLGEIKEISEDQEAGSLTIVLEV